MEHEVVRSDMEANCNADIVRVVLLMSKSCMTLYTNTSGIVVAFYILRHAGFLPQAV